MHEIEAAVQFAAKPQSTPSNRRLQHQRDANRSTIRRFCQHRRIGAEVLPAPASLTCSAHVLWIRLCARMVTMVQSLDFYRKIPTARKNGTARHCGKNRGPEAADAINMLTARCSAHLLWIRLCASTLTTPQSLDSFTYFSIAQKQGKRHDCGKAGGFDAPDSRLAQRCKIAPGFCTPSVDKIVRKRVDTGLSR